jgi:hypothetical protein
LERSRYNLSAMKCLMLAVLLTFMQTPAPVPRKATNPSNRTAQSVTKQSGSDKTPAQQAPSIVQSISTQPNQDTSRSPAAENAQKPVVIRELPPVSVTKDWLDKTYIAFTGILIVVGIVGVRAAYKTLGEIKVQREAMQGQLTAIQGQLAQATQQTGELKAASEIALVAAQAAVVNAKAAKVSADIAAAVSIPTLKIERFATGNAGAANIRAILQFPKVSITIKNYGQTAAFLQWWSIMFTCEELPDIPVYSGNSYGMPLDKEVVHPNHSYTLPDLNFIQRPQISLDDVEAIIRREKILTVCGYVCYGDLFDNPIRRLKFCEFTLNVWEAGEEGGIDWCQETDPNYSGTDLLPVSKSSSGQGIEGQPARGDTKAEDRPG